MGLKEREREREKKKKDWWMVMTQQLAWADEDKYMHQHEHMFECNFPDLHQLEHASRQLSRPTRRRLRERRE